MTANIPVAEETADNLPVKHVMAKPFDIRQLVDHVADCCAAAERA